MTASSAFQSHTINSSPTNLSMSNPNIFLEPGAEIRNCHVSDGLYMERYSGLNRTRTLGPCGIGSFSYISDAVISQYCHIGPRSSVGGFEHPYTSISQSSFFWGQNTHFFLKESTNYNNPSNKRPNEKRTTLNPDVWIGSNCVVKSGVILGVGSILGAGSILTTNTQPFGIYVGNPAKLLKFRFEPEIIDELIESQWWELPLEFLMQLNFKDVIGSIKQITEYKNLDY